MSPAARIVVSMQLSQASKLCHRRAAARPLSRTSDKPKLASLATRSAHRELFRASHDLSTSNDVYPKLQRQTMSLTRTSSSLDHVPKSTRPGSSARALWAPLFSAGSKVIRGIIARRRESLGTRLEAPRVSKMDQPAHQLTVPRMRRYTCIVCV